MEDSELLKRRLEREGRARREAEQLLETKSAELFRAKEQLQSQYDALLKRNAKIDLLDSIVAFAQRSTGFYETLQRFLDVVCKASGWPVGHVYVPYENDPSRMRPLKIWHLDDPQMFESFRRVTEETSLDVGSGLPGRVLASGEPAWIDDVHTDGNFPRAMACKEIKVRAAFGVPIRVYDRTVAIAEFYAGETFEKDPWLLDIVSTTAQQLGSLLERQQAEHSLERVNRELRHRNEEMEQFVYTVSHDLKAPVVTMIGFLSMLQEDLAAGRGEDAQDSLKHIGNAAERMGQLIKDLLEFSRIGRVVAQPEPIDTAAMVRQIVESLGLQLEQSRASLHVQEDMPHVRMDRPRLTQVFENLITNAIKYGCEGGSAQISVGGEAEGGEVRFFVKDNGPGIAPEYHEKIFGLFQRLHSDKRGTGVGLAIVARVMQVHNGRAWVDSKPGHGATFWVALPASMLVRDEVAVY